MGWLFGTGFVVLVSFKRFHASQIPETNLNSVIVWCVRDFYNCPEHMVVGNVLYCLSFSYSTFYNSRFYSSNLGGINEYDNISIFSADFIYYINYTSYGKIYPWNKMGTITNWKTITIHLYHRLLSE